MIRRYDRSDEVSQARLKWNGSALHAFGEPASSFRSRNRQEPKTATEHLPVGEIQPVALNHLRAHVKQPPSCQRL